MDGKTWNKAQSAMIIDIKKGVVRDVWQRILGKTLVNECKEYYTIFKDEYH